MPFPQAPAGAWWILGGWRQSGWLWCCGRSCWWCSRRMTKRSSPAGFRSGEEGVNERRVQSHSTPKAKPGSSLDLWAGAESCCPHPGSCHRPPDCTRRSPHSSAKSRYTLVLTFKPTSKMWGGMMWPSLWNHTKDHDCSWKLCFHHLGHVSVIRGYLDLHFEGADNGPVVITWIGREYWLYSGTSLISLVKHCVTVRHGRRLLSLLGFVHNWPTSRWSATKKRKTGFHLTEMESCRLF